MRTLEDLPPHVCAEISQFFDIYTGLDDGPEISNDGQDGQEVAVQVPAESRERWRNRQD